MARRTGPKQAYTAIYYVADDEVADWCLAVGAVYVDAVDEEDAYYSAVNRIASVNKANPDDVYCVALYIGSNFMDDEVPVSGLRIDDDVLRLLKEKEGW